MKERQHNGEIVVYQPDEITRLEVMVENETVWLTQAHLAQLFGVNQPAISKHIRNIYSSGELSPEDTYSILEYMGNDGKQKYSLKYYNLDMILSVGYRINSKNAISFRRWANTILKEYLLKGYHINNRLDALEDKIERRMSEHDKRLDAHEQKIDFFVRTSLPPVEGIFYDGQIFDAYVFATELIRSARTKIVLIDNYIDESVLMMLSKRKPGVKAEIRTGKSPHRNLDHHFPDGHRIPYRDTWLVDVGWEEDEHDRAIGDVSVRFVQIVEKDNIPFAVIFLRRNSIIQCTGIYVFLARDDILNVYICTVGLIFRIQLRFIF